MNTISKQIDLSKVRTVVYHLPDGKSYEVEVEGLEQFLDFGVGKICDTSEINGTVHFYPKGNA